MQYRISNEIFYNEQMIDVRNPELRQLLTQLRDDEMRAVVKLQQKEERMKNKGGIAYKLFPVKPRY